MDVNVDVDVDVGMTREFLAVFEGQDGDRGDGEVKVRGWEFCGERG